MIPIRVSRNDNEMNECAHCGREYALDDTPSYCIDDCPGYTRKGELAPWLIEQHIAAAINCAADGDMEGADVSATAAVALTAKCEYSHAHMENAMMLTEHLAADLCNPVISTPWLEALGGSAGMRDHVAKVAVEIEQQFTALGLQWDQDADWYDLCDRVADAIKARPLVAPAVLVKDVMNAELKIVFRPEAT